MWLSSVVGPLTVDYELVVVGAGLEIEFGSEHVVFAMHGFLGLPFGPLSDQEHFPRRVRPAELRNVSRALLEVIVATFLAALFRRVWRVLRRIRLRLHLYIIHFEEEWMISYRPAPAESAKQCLACWSG